MTVIGREEQPGELVGLSGQYSPPSRRGRHIALRLLREYGEFRPFGSQDLQGLCLIANADAAIV
jgi:hypothetical protein